MEHPYPLGTVIVKAGTEPGDLHQDGARGRICRMSDNLWAHLARNGLIFSHYLGPDKHGRYAYYVEWDDMPGTPVGIMSHRIKPL